MRYLKILQEFENGQTKSTEATKSDHIASKVEPIPSTGIATADARAAGSCELSEKSEKSAGAKQSVVEATRNSHPVPPSQRCKACNGWLFWISFYGAMVCAVCHPPANPRLVERWYWLPEGECKQTQ